MKIYNHDIRTSTHETSGGTHLYSGRALGLSEPTDIIQIHPALKPEWDSIAAHYARIGLRHSHNVLWSLSLAHLQTYADYEPSVYFFGDAVCDHSPCAQFYRDIDQRWFDVVTYINAKNNFIELAQRLGLPVPATACFNRSAAVGQLERFTYPCYLKPSVSDSGFGILYCQDARQLAAALMEWSDPVPFQIQAEAPSATFINLQYQVTENGIERLLVSEQILNGCVHGGNRYPTAHQPWSYFDPLAQWLAEQGMKGLFAFDAAVVDGAEHPYLAIECNPRFNGSSYPTLIAQKLGILQWSSETLMTDYHSLADLELRDLEFNPDLGTGIILINWGTILVGKISVLLAGTTVQQAALRTELQNQLMDSEQLRPLNPRDYITKELAKISGI
ncbi:ATP-grasp domain-containing protein [Acaryochloris sp. IP29b_bin.137]|uniref:ATP-grasp domain-containing protein n=1 Tax=Acaryochloris sp. IP29b_bin.137 TaxID=2969217 RepID=UPI00262236F3|nr:ATP-grasp domain-containing protein [Acaryochloris sp. IP29b_bin.137]